MAPENENPVGPVEGASGADNADLKAACKNCPKWRRSAMQLFAKDSHKRVSRTLGYALTANDPISWARAAIVFEARMTIQERASAAYALLVGLKSELLYDVYHAAQWGEVAPEDFAEDDPFFASVAEDEGPR